jgi:hypothetical protein
MLLTGVRQPRRSLSPRGGERGLRVVPLDVFCFWSMPSAAYAATEEGLQLCRNAGPVLCGRWSTRWFGPLRRRPVIATNGALAEGDYLRDIWREPPGLTELRLFRDRLPAHLGDLYPHDRERLPRCSQGNAREYKVTQCGKFEAVREHLRLGAPVRAAREEPKRATVFVTQLRDYIADSRPRVHLSLTIRGID